MLLAAALLGAVPASASWMVPPSPYMAKDFAMVKRDGVYHLFYIRNNPVLPFAQTQTEFGHATSADLYFWTHQPTVLPIRPGRFDQAHVWAPSIVERDGVYYMFYTGVADSGGVHVLDQRTGIATSTDLMTWNRLDLPVHQCLDVPWTWCDSTASTPFRDPFVIEDPDAPGNWWMTYVTARSDDPGGMVVGLARSTGDLTSWQDEGWVSATDRSVTYSDLAESPHLFRHEDLWFLFFTTNSGQPLSFATTPAPLSSSSAWTYRGRLTTMLGYTTAGWFASEYFRDGLVEYFLHVNGDRIAIHKMLWTGPAQFTLAQPDLFHVQRLTWGWGSVTVGQSVALYIQSKWWSGRSISLEAFWVDDQGGWHPVVPADIGLPAQIELTADLQTYLWAAQALPASYGAPEAPWIVVRLPDQTAVSNLIQLYPQPQPDPDPVPWPGDPEPGAGMEPGTSPDNPRLRTLKSSLFGTLPGVVVELGAETDARLDVYDLLGRRVRSLAERTLPAGATVHVWDGRDATGRRLGSGVYFVRLSTARTSATTRVLLP